MNYCRPTLSKRQYAVTSIVQQSSLHRSLSCLNHTRDFVDIRDLIESTLIEKLQGIDAEQICEKLNTLFTKHFSLSTEDSESWLVMHTVPIFFPRDPAHLFPVNAHIDFLYTIDSNKLPIFAIKRKLLPNFLDLYTKEVICKSLNYLDFNFTLDHYRTKLFEKGEIAITRYPEVNWKEISNAAIICAVDWPEKECAEFMQSLFFGRYLGDETGLFLNILHP